MDLMVNKAAIINASVNKRWYPKGTDRLVKSLNFVGWAGGTLTWRDEWPNDNFNKECGYHVKPAAWEEAIKKGYNYILWVDCSIWAIRDPMPIFDIMGTQGYFFWKSGWNCAQTSSDKALSYFGIDRDTAETWEEASTSVFGVNLDNPLGKEFIERWLQSARDGVFEGSRDHDGQSQDPRFKFHRQDQTAASLILNDMGLSMTNPREYVQYWNKSTMEENIPDSLVFLMRGM
jgi:hypothetical protein